MLLRGVDGAAIQANLRETTTRVLASLTPHEERALRVSFEHPSRSRKLRSFLDN